MLTQEQKALRVSRVSGSDIAAVAGLDPWRGPWDVYARKKGLIDDSFDTFHTERGRFLEPALIRWYEQRAGCVVTPVGTLIHPLHNRIVATPDGEAVFGDERRALEIKAPSWRNAAHFGDAGTDKIPSYYLPQVTWECAVMGVDSADMAAFIDGDLRIYHIPFNPRLFDALRELAERFLHDHLDADEPPAPGASESARAWLEKMYPRATAALLDASDEMLAVAHEYDDARTLEKDAAERKEAARNQLVAMLGEHEGAKAPGVSVSYRNNKDSEKVDYAALIREVPPELVRKHTRTVQGPRVLRVTVKA